MLGMGLNSHYKKFACFLVVLHFLHILVLYIYICLALFASNGIFKLLHATAVNMTFYCFWCGTCLTLFVIQFAYCFYFNFKQVTMSLN